MNRDEKGRFVRGCEAGPGRTPKEIKGTYLEILQEAVTPADWLKVAQKALRQAMSGDKNARQWLSDYLLGKPIQELTVETREEKKIILTWDDDDAEPDTSEAP